jgi:hypothetical protein
MKETVVADRGHIILTDCGETLGSPLEADRARWLVREDLAKERAHGGPRNSGLEIVTKMVSHPAIRKSFYHGETDASVMANSYVPDHIYFRTEK